jgi:hypothetical protein
MKSNRRRLLHLFIAFVLVVSFQKATAQIATGTFLDKSSIENQFNTVLNSSSRYEDSKIIKEGWMYILKTHVNDTIRNLQKDLHKAQQTFLAKDAVIDSLKKELAQTEELYQSTKEEKNNLNILGISFHKTTYNSLMWTIIFGLLFLLVILILLYRKNNAVTIQTRKDLDELKLEYEAHRKKALEREEKLSRQYLDELNKYKR